MFLNALLSDCGLSCEAGAHVYTLTDGEQTMVDMCKIIGVTLCFIAIVFSTWTKLYAFIVDRNT